jgi:hypothetical protein
MATSNINWGDIGDDMLGAALEWYLQQQRQKTPNFTPQPLTPEDKYWDEQRKKMFEAGGAPEVQAVRNAGFQYLQQIPSGPTNFKFMSPHLQGQSFSGGVQVPKFDFSMMAAPGGKPQTTERPVGGRIPDSFSGGPEGGFGQRQFRQVWEPAGGETDYDRWGESIYGRMTRDPSYVGNERDFPTTGGSSDPNKPTKPPGFIGPTPPGETRYGTGNPIAAVANAFQDFKASHPNWASLGINGIAAALAATLGLPGAIIGKILQSLLNAGGGKGGDEGGFIPGSISGTQTGLRP